MQANSRNDLIQAWPGVAPDAVINALAPMMDAYMARMQICNFTAHRTPERFALYNMVDSVLPFLDGRITLPDRSLVADIGTGGGFPGVPLAALFPLSSFSLFDSVGKKLRIIDEVCEEVGIKNVQTHQLRLEEYGQGAGRETFDVVTSRAVAHWTTLLELALPLLKIGGYFYAWQGEKIFEELEAKDAALRFLGGKFEATREYDLGEGGKRYLVVIKKTHKTPADYPRDYSIMVKRPL